MKWVLLFALLPIATACGREQQQQQRGEPWEETLIADVVAINGEVPTAGFRVTFFNTDQDPAAERYQLDSRCRDFGYFDERHQRFLSGSSPIGTDAEKSTDRMRREVADGPIRACGSNQAADYEQILRIMQEGATFTDDGAGAARLVTPRGRSIDLIVVPSF